MTKANAPQTQTKKPHKISTWLFHNIILLVICIVLGFFLKQVSGYDWVVNAYSKKTLFTVKSQKNATYVERMTAKLGLDYLYMIYVRDHTPENSIIYLPTREDFMTPLNGNPSPFKASLTDKLSAARILYPRRVVTSDEWGKTSWSRYTTHIAIINNKNIDKLSYPVDSFIPFGVMPTMLPISANNHNNN